jgi:hypothetical protein
MRHGLKLPARSPEERAQQRFANIENRQPAWRGDDGWHVVGAGGEPAFQNAWVAFGATYQAPRFRRDATGTVYIEGAVKTGTVNTGIFVLPVGYRPLADLYLPSVGNGPVFGAFTIGSAGGLTQQAGGNAFFSITCNFKASG